MNDMQYAEHCLQLLADYATDFVKRTESLESGDHLQELAGAFQVLVEAGPDIYIDGPNLISRLFTSYPDFAPDFPRELLWFLGGECLHFMPDDEIEVFQQLEELRTQAATRGEIIDFEAARAKLLKTQ
jgi:hypothetical protein